ncbi:iron permease FTR1 family-domain-containing protein [Zopfochytrium polystomum]|nr:iron permease FTR1 family-domain-containing protein [Zopfochytrium polystomum]
MFGFSVPIFFITMREALEAAVVVSVLASFVHQSFPRGTYLYKRMFGLILSGTLLAVAISVVIGAAFLVVWFKYATNLWKSAEELWEGIEGLVAGVMLTVLAFGFLQSEELTEKWHKKLRRQLVDQIAPSERPLADDGPDMVVEEDDRNDTDSIASKQSLEDKIFNAVFNFFKKRSAAPRGDETTAVGKKNEADGAVLSTSNTAGYTLFILPFITVLREGLECVVFIGGIGITSDPGTIPLAAVIGLGCGALLGYLIYRLGNSLKARAFFLVSTIFILVLAVGLTTRSVGKIENYRFKQRIGTNLDLTESPVRDVNSTIWYLNCCNPEEEVSNNYGWQVFSAIFGWNNQGTYLTVFLYAGYCIVVAGILVGYKLFRVRRVLAKRERRAMRAAAAKLEIAAAAGETAGVPDEKTEKSELPRAAGDAETDSAEASASGSATATAAADAAAAAAPAVTTEGEEFLSISK